MKRTIIILFTIAIITIVTTSCYTTHKCPAYGYNTEIVDERNEI